MKHPILFLLFLTALASCGQNPSGKLKATDNNATANEQALLDSIGFEPFVLAHVRKFSQAPISRLQRSFSIYYSTEKELKTTTKKHNGFSVKTDEQNAREMVLNLKDELKEKGYLIYISDVHFGYEPDVVSVLKSTDQFEILRVEETSAVNYDMDNQMVLEKLQEWNKQYPFQIIGADGSRVEAIFTTLPKNMKAFAKEVYEFCPDVVDQGTGSVKELEKEMTTSRTLYLWWD